jgi:hypothetical protein
MSSCAFGRAGARCVRPYAELEAHCDASGERFPLLAMRLACGALTAALQPPRPREQHPGAQRPRRGDPLTVRADKGMKGPQTTVFSCMHRKIHQLGLQTGPTTAAPIGQ